MINKNWKDHWKLLANSKKITAVNMVEYCLLKALTAKSQNKVEIAESLLRAAFTPVGNTTKLANGRFEYDSLSHALDWTYRIPKTIFGFDISLIMDEEGLEEWKNLRDQVRVESVHKNEPDYLFLFVRQDISKEQQAVQASHAAFKAGYNKTAPLDPSSVHFVLIGVDNEQELIKAGDTLARNNHEFHSFREPDLGNSLTAVASEPMRAHKKRFLRHYAKLKFD